MIEEDFIRKLKFQMWSEAKFNKFEYEKRMAHDDFRGVLLSKVRRNVADALDNKTDCTEIVTEVDFPENTITYKHVINCFSNAELIQFIDFVKEYPGPAQELKSVLINQIT